MNREGMSCRIKSADIFHALCKRSEKDLIKLIDPQEEYQKTQCPLREKAVKKPLGMITAGKDE